MRIFVILFFLFVTPILIGQTITGVVKDKAGKLLVGVNVFSKKHNIGTTTNLDGEFEINRKASIDILTFSYLGFYEYNLKLISGKMDYLIQLKDTNTALQEVLVVGKTKAQKLREEAYSVIVIEAKELKNRSTDVNEILSKISGVNIRQSGGLGSETTLSINGLSENQIRIFINGVPMDYFGKSLSLNNFPANIIEQIEVYKGVVPIHLSSDALGGAVNIVTNSGINSFLDVSYSLATYNTRRAAVNGQFRNANNGFTFRVKSFFNTANNNYKIPVKLVNFETGKEDEFATLVERFHDGYNSKMAWLEAGLTKTKFADELMFGVMYSDNNKEIQQAENNIGDSKVPYGEVTTSEEKIITNFSFRKTGMLKNKLAVNSYVVAVFSEEESKDISSYTYDWFQHKKLRSDLSTGETENRKTLLKLTKENYLANINAEYAFNSQHNIAINYSLNYLNLHGSDAYKKQNDTQFKNPSKVLKQVVGLSYSNGLFEDKLNNVLFGKYYSFQNKSTRTSYSGTVSEPFQVNQENFGVGFASTYKLEYIQVKFSFENAVRFPEVIELFGNGLNVVPNPELIPETSKNYNLGFTYKNRPLFFSFDFFIRDTENYILPQVVGIKTHFINNKSVFSKGIDFSASTDFRKKVFLSLNTTYLDKRNSDRWRNAVGGIENSTYMERIPNEPYFFGNLVASYKNNKLFHRKDNYAISFTQAFVNEFNYKWGNQGRFNKPVVPSQWTSDVECVYSIFNGKYNASFRVSNVWDATVYDNYLQVKPGRMFHLKLRYYIN
tara:strand:- start:4476 stop:6815 length:2340 start_codon:yes stop_codon:yes gene_type:complete